MKQTAVEFLVDEFKEKLIGHNLPEWVEKIIEQAKAMEKEHIEYFYKQGHLYSGCPYGLEEVYIKTFKSE